MALEGTAIKKHILNPVGKGTKQCDNNSYSEQVMQ